MQIRLKRSKDIPLRFTSPLSQSDRDKISKRVHWVIKGYGCHIDMTKNSRTRTEEEWINLHHQTVDWWCDRFGSVYFNPEELIEYRYFDRRHIQGLPKDTNVTETETFMLVDKSFVHDDTYMSIDDHMVYSKISRGQAITLGKFCTAFCKDCEVKIEKKQSPRGYYYNRYPTRIIEMGYDMLFGKLANA